MGLEAVAGAAAGATPYGAIAQAAIGVTQAGIGMLQSAVANARLKKLMKQRTAYSSPAEYQDAFNLATNQAQSGYSAETMAYLTNQNDRGLSSSLDSIKRLGGNANDVADIADKSFQASMKIGSDSEMLKMKKFDTVYNTIYTVANEKKAEWADKEAILKDKMAAQAMKAQAGGQNQQSGFNNIAGAAANYFTAKTYPGTTPNQTPNQEQLAPLSQFPSYNPQYQPVPVPLSLQGYINNPQMPSWYKG